jgi:hypothetical protein
MATIQALAALTLLGAGVVAAGEVRLVRTIDLDRPGALQALQQSNPAHYENVRRIIEGVLQRPDTEVPRWIQVTFNGRDVWYAPVVMTSDPPRRRLSFALDDTRYETVITLTNVRGHVVPLK